MHDTQDPPATFTYAPVGTIHSPFRDIAGMPIQPNGARGTQGTIEIFARYREGLLDLSGFERVILIYALHKCVDHNLTVKPFLDTTPRGIFATRSPKRPNAIGLSVVRLLAVDMAGGTLTIEDVDVLDGTPLLDLKPYVPVFDAYPGSRCGWLESVCKNAETTRSDDRFR
ncbi:MAG: tRNA (N6-threonylcarbamoyladenosine(37)-N6)-methyltransferase TrmO [Methanoregula sp.]|uniref:tRNA (N6-threonylcarbamoyladenosine(37)-N6)-methyltransferase TrmO n=1 Tax=Methanoregula sp. TaxID=2052170 RepID=UPI0025E14F97|nr:tRNA (N6-threonylcarbamoyladenosine(37)-N6)-methyltransferase TrmO [Methanoregula sp.]MCK9631086.1 tRNA (N6-threonylcarbamoyladenosine(37)-N6)-methyltransferase TrmO [Methanoregula sp.]